MSCGPQKGDPQLKGKSDIIKEMKVEGQKLEKGDWIVVEGDNWEENGMVVDLMMRRLICLMVKRDGL